MVMTNFLQKRKSVRDFKNKEIARDDIEAIKNYIEEIEKETASVSFKFYENGSIIYDGLKGKAGYSGVMIESPSYIALMKNDETKESCLNTGYYLEKLNTKIVNLDLDSCWITLDNVDETTKSNLFGADGPKVDYVIALGHGVGKKLFTPETTSGRYTMDKIVFKDEIGNAIFEDELETLGLLDIFATVRFAPSHKNCQAWRFVIKDHSIVLYMEKTKEDSRSLVDMGVMMFYFEEMAKTIGRYGKWSVILEDEDKYLKVAEFSM